MKSFLPSMRKLIGILLVVFASSALPAQKRSTSAEFPLWKFDETEQGCRAKGRLQDKEYCSSPIVDDVLAGGKDSVPVLISQLTDTRRTKDAAFDYWSHTAAGDVAFFLLTDLFTDGDWKTFNMPGVPSWATIHHRCNDASETCWRQYLTKHGRRSIQAQWREAWNKNKDRVHWDEKNHCFRVN